MNISNVEKCIMLFLFHFFFLLPHYLIFSYAMNFTMKFYNEDDFEQSKVVDYLLFTLVANSSSYA